MTVYFEASYGGIRIDIDTLSDEGGRAIAVQELTRGDGAVLQDRGRRLRRTHAQLLFFHLGGDDDHRERFLAFKALAEADGPQLLVHPIDGAYEARVDDLRYSLDADNLDAIPVAVTFLEEETPVGMAINRAGAGVARSAGLAAVEVSAAKLEDELAARGASSDAPAAALAEAQRWATAATVSAREVSLGLRSVTARIAADVDRLGVATDLEAYPLWQELTRLHDVMVRAAASVTVATSRRFSITVVEATPLRVICARTYGGAEAEDRYRQILELNDLRHPGAVPGGTVLSAPAPGSERRGPA